MKKAYLFLPAVFLLIGCSHTLNNQPVPEVIIPKGVVESADLERIKAEFEDKVAREIPRIVADLQMVKTLKYGEQVIEPTKSQPEEEYLTDDEGLLIKALEEWK